MCIFKLADDGNHGRIVGGVAELWNIDGPAVLLGMLVKSVAQSVICRHPTRHSHVGNASGLYCQAQFLHQDVYDGML